MQRRDFGAAVGRYLTPAGRQGLGAFTQGRVEVLALRWEHVRDWSGLGQLLIAQEDKIAFNDGEEWFTLELK